MHCFGTRAPALLLLLALAPLLRGEISVDRDELQFDGKTYRLARSVADAEGIWNQYLPHGQNLENWTHSLSLRLYFQHDDPVTLMERQQDQVSAAFPDADFGSQITRDEREARLRYHVYTKKPVPVSELSMWRFIRMEDSRLQVLAYQFSYRERRDDPERFEQALKENLSRWTELFLRGRFQPPAFRVNHRQLDALQEQAIRLIQEGKMSEGLTMMMDAVERDPLNPQRHFNLGRILFTYAKSLLQAETLQEAMLLFNRSQEVLEETADLFEIFDPEAKNHSMARFLLGEIEFQINGNFEVARLHYEEALAIDPLNRDAREALRVYRK